MYPSVRQKKSLVRTPKEPVDDSLTINIFTPHIVITVTPLKSSVGDTNGMLNTESIPQSKLTENDRVDVVNDRINKELQSISITDWASSRNFKLIAAAI